MALSRGNFRLTIPIDDDDKEIQNSQLVLSIREKHAYMSNIAKYEEDDLLSQNSSGDDPF